MACTKWMASLVAGSERPMSISMASPSSISRCPVHMTAGSGSVDDHMTVHPAVLRLPEHDKQRNNGERRKHQELVVVDIGDDLGLLRDQRVQRRASGIGQRIQESR